MVSFEQIRYDDSVEQLQLPELPKEIEIWVDKKIKDQFPEPTILDYAKDEKVELLFIPPIPLPMDFYDFYNLE